MLELIIDNKVPDQMSRNAKADPVLISMFSSVLFPFIKMQSLYNAMFGVHSNKTML